MMQISFYVLGARYMDNVTSDTAPAINAEAVLDFICRLTQTVLNKSENSLVIVDDNLDRLRQLDDKLWTFDPVSFIPHNLITDASYTEHLLSAPVTLLPTQPEGFDGVVLNLAKAPLPLSNNATLPERVLEIITPDENSKAQGREKYRTYRELGFELTYYPID